MSRRSLLVPALAMCAMLCAAAPAAGFGPGETFLTGGLDLPAGAIAGGQSGFGPGNGADQVAVSQDGRYVAFTAQADTLDPAAHPDVYNVFRKDRDTGEVVLVSRATGKVGAAFAAPSGHARISNDGRKVAFSTEAALDPVADRDGGASDVYVRDVYAGTTVLATVDTATDVDGFDLSGDGRFVVFATEEQIDVANDRNAHSDVYRRELGRETALVSVADVGDTSAADGASSDPSISDDGVWVAFASQANNVVSPDPGSGGQVVARDMTARTTYLVSNASGSFIAGANGGSAAPDVAGRPASGDRAAVIVAYTSTATNIDNASDSSPQSSIYRRELDENRSVLVSRETGSSGEDADGQSYRPSISADGARVTFTSVAENLGLGAGGNTTFGVYVRNVPLAVTAPVSADNKTAVEGGISADGGFVAWVERGAVTADTDPDLYGVFGRSYLAPSTLDPIELVSRPPGTATFLAAWIEARPSEGTASTVSADGRYIAFAASSSRLPGTGESHIYRRDVLTGAIELISRANGATGTPADGENDIPSISADGTRIAFISDVQIDPAHPPRTSQAYVRDLAAATTTLASRAEGAGGAAADDDVSEPAISSDGTHVAFTTSATNLGVSGAVQHVYVRDLTNGGTLLVDRGGGPAGVPGNDSAELPSLSADGRWVAFGSQADNLVEADADRFADVFVRDTVAGTTLLLSRRSGLDGDAASGASYFPSISADGRVVAFQADDETLAPEGGTWGGNSQVVARTVATGQNVLVSRAPGGAVADVFSFSPSVNGDGSVIAFQSAATNLLPGVGGGVRHGVFARTMATGVLSGPPAFGLIDVEPQNRAAGPSISADGQCLGFYARGHNAITGTAGDGSTTYMHVVSGECPKPALAPPPVARRAVRAPRLRARLTRKRFRVGRARTARVAGPAALRLEARAAARRGKRKAAKRRAARRKACLRRAGRRPARRRACLRGGRRAKAGTAFVVTLTERANVGIAIERQAQGRLVGRFCRKPRPRLRRNLRCIRFVKVGNLSRRGVSAGRTRIAFSGRIGKRALKPGKYRVRARATNAGGSSRWVRLRFRVVRR